MVPQRSVTPVKGSDGRYHVMYELLLTNTVARPARLRSVQVRDAASGRRLQIVTVRDMVAGGMMHQLDRMPVRNAVLPRGQARLLLLSLSFRSRKAVPRAVEHRFDLTAADIFTQRSMRFRYVAGRVAISRQTPPVLAPPLEGPGWLASDGCCTAGGHVSAIFGLDGKLQAAERYAIDWIKISPDGRIFHGDPSVLSNWAGYGAKVNAVADGIVTSVIDGLPNQVPQVKPGDLDFDALPGNLVVVRMKGGFSVGFAHLIPGSVRVKVGDRVRAGDELGLLGNSGGSLAPHLHFHVVDGPSVTTSDGYPFTIDSFRLAATSGLDGLFAALRGDAGFPRRDQMRPVEHTDELPLGFTIDDFPGG